MGIVQLFYTPGILFSRFSAITFLGGEKRGEQTAEMAREAAISNWLAAFGAPEILTPGKDKRFPGGIFQDFCAYRDIISQAVIPGNRQSLGAAERRNAHFRGTIDRIIGKSQAKFFAAETMAWISGYGCATLKFASAAVRWFYSGATGFWENAKIANWYSW